MNKIRIIVIEDNRLLRDGIAAMINEQPDLRVVATIGDGEKTLQKIKETKPRIVLLDLGLRSHNSLLLVKSIKSHYPELKIIVMALVRLQTDILEFVQAGVSGFILKDAKISDFLKAIRSVSRGEKFLPPNLTDSLFSQIAEQAINGIGKSKLIQSVRLTKREHQIVELIADGLTNKEIGKKLFLSPFTVKSHIHNILEKMELHTRVQLGIYARTNTDFKDAARTISLMDE